MRRHGQTSAEDAGTPVGDTPSPLCRLLVLSLLLSARISADIGAAARELSSAGWRTPKSMQDATWQQRVDALGWSGHRPARSAAQVRRTNLDPARRAGRRRPGSLPRRSASVHGTDFDAAPQESTGIGPVGVAIFRRGSRRSGPTSRPTSTTSPPMGRRRWTCRGPATGWQPWSRRRTCPSDRRLRPDVARGRGRRGGPLPRLSHHRRCVPVDGGCRTPLTECDLDRVQSREGCPKWLFMIEGVVGVGSRRSPAHSPVRPLPRRGVG